jgi:tetratricopeptide (TPR) repeat protein
MFQSSETCYRMVIQTNPAAWPAHLNLGIVLMKDGRLDQARPYLEKVLQLNPDAPARGAAYANLGTIYLRKGLLEQALAFFKKSLDAWPDFRQYNSIGGVLHRQGKLGEAVVNYEKALQLEPRSPLAQTNLAWVLATASDRSLRNGPKALDLSLQAHRFSGGQDPFFLHTLAAAYAETANFPKAVETAQLARQRATDKKMTALVDQLQNEIALYELGLPLREKSN